MDRSITLNNGTAMPIVGLGTWKLKADEMDRAVNAALDAGYRHFDCAYVYGNEKAFGESLKGAMQRLKLKREDVFVTGKLWHTFHAKEDVPKCLELSLADLQLDYLDLFLIHWPVGYLLLDPAIKISEAKEGGIAYSDVHFTETWAAMEGLVRAGKCKAIGLSNFNSKQIEEIIQKATILPAVNQVECHPFFPQVELLNFCRERGIVVTAYSPLGCGDWRQKPVVYPNVFAEPKIQKVADRLGRTVAQVAIRFQVQRGLTVIPKSSTPSHIQANINVFDFELSEEDIMMILTILPKERIIDMFVKDKNDGLVLDDSGRPIPQDRDHPLYPFNEPF